MDKELRFAVVMYGGVSLAIYINGIAQELLCMSNSTSSDENHEIKSTEKVYGLISCLLSNEELKDEISELVTNYINVEKNVEADEKTYENIKKQKEFERNAIEKEIVDFIKNAKNKKTKFVVDVLSGTSAGGINSIYLAKALANNQEINKLKDLWIGEGDIATLLNDKKSVLGTSLTRPDKPKSLLNTRRLFLKLLEAFNEMGIDKKVESNHLNELDLFVTTTDFHGVVAPLRLYDGVVFERRYRQVFNFRYDKNKKINNFKQENNPTLAFSARCTSAFPFAFEPMTFREAESVLSDTFDESNLMLEKLATDINEFLPKVFDKDQKEIDWSKRDFVDGGVLDNKPFSYIVDVLSKKRSDYRGKRKLLYIEPSPEKFGKEGKLITPNALETAKAAVLEMPAYETIREDIEQLIVRNDAIRRVNVLIMNSEKDVYENLTSRTIEDINTEDINYFLTEISINAEPVTWSDKGLNDIAKKRGIAVLPYYRLRISSLTDELALISARKNGFDEKLEYFSALRLIVYIWRKNNFDENSTNQKNPINQDRTIMKFLKDFDLDYRLRRLKFVLQKSEELFKFNRGFREKLRERSKKLIRYRSQEKDKEKKIPENEKSKQEINKFPTEIIWDKLGVYFDYNYEIVKPHVKGNPMFNEVSGHLQTEIDKLSIIIKEKELLKTQKVKLIKERGKLHYKLNNTKNALNLLNKDLNEQLKLDEDSFQLKMELDKIIIDVNIKLENNKKNIDKVKKKYEILHNKRLEKENILEQYVSDSLISLHLPNNESLISAEEYKKILNIYLTFFQSEINRIQEEFEVLIDEIQQAKQSLHQLINNDLENEKESSTKLTDKEIERLLEIRDEEQISRQNSYDPYSEKKLNSIFLNDEQSIKIYRKIKETINRLEESFNEIFENPRDKIKTLFQENKGQTLSEAIQGYLWHYYISFDHYDQISFPVYYQSQVGEATEIDVLRISPQDAKSLVDEKKDNKQKLAGESLFHFGAMLDPVWRQNDIMWGRLDGAERLITALIPEEKHKDLRANLTKMAHLEVFQEEILDNSGDYLTDLLAGSLVNISAGIDAHSAIEKVTKISASQVVKSKIRSFVESSFERHHIYDYFKDNYKYDERLEPKPLLQTLSRTTKITGDVLDGVAEDFNVSGSKLRWIARLGQIFWGLIEIAAPNSLLNTMLTQWLMLLYFFEVLIIAGSTLLGKSEIQQFGVIALILTLIIHLTSVALNDYMRGGKILYLLKFVAGGVLSVLIIAGAIFIYAIFYDLTLLQEIVDKQTFFKDYQLWQRLIPISLIVLLFASTLAWREARTYNIKSYGIITLIYSALSLGIGFVFMLMVSEITYYISPILALEFIESAEQVTRIFGNVGSNARFLMKYVLILDSFLFVPIYTAFLLYFSRLIEFRRSEWTIFDSNWYQQRLSEKNDLNKKPSVAGNPDDVFVRLHQAFSNLSFLSLTMIVISLMIIIAGLADLSENYFSYWLMVNSEINTEGWMINGVYYSAMLKWFLLSLIVTSLSLVFWRGVCWKFLSFIFFLLGIFGLYCLFNDIEIMHIFMIAQLTISIIAGVLLLIFNKQFNRA